MLYSKYVPFSHPDGNSSTREKLIWNLLLSDSLIHNHPKVVYLFLSDSLIHNHPKVVYLFLSDLLIHNHPKVVYFQLFAK